MAELRAGIRSLANWPAIPQALWRRGGPARGPATSSGKCSQPGELADQLNKAGVLPSPALRGTDFPLRPLRARQGTDDTYQPPRCINRCTRRNRLISLRWLTRRRSSRRTRPAATGERSMADRRSFVDPDRQFARAACDESTGECALAAPRRPDRDKSCNPARSPYTHRRSRSVLSPAIAAGRRVFRIETVHPEIAAWLVTSDRQAFGDRHPQRSAPFIWERPTIPVGGRLLRPVEQSVLREHVEILVVEQIAFAAGLARSDERPALDLSPLEGWRTGPDPAATMLPRAPEIRKPRTRLPCPSNARNAVVLQ